MLQLWTIKIFWTTTTLGAEMPSLPVLIGAMAQAIANIAFVTAQQDQ